MIQLRIDAAGPDSADATIMGNTLAANETAVARFGLSR
jgi:hypothetical protein